LPDAPHRAARRACPEAQFAAMKPVNIKILWYYSSADTGAAASAAARAVRRPAPMTRYKYHNTIIIDYRLKTLAARLGVRDVAGVSPAAA